MEQKLTTWTTIHFDFFDRLRILFGAKVQVEIVIHVVQPEQIKTYNASSSINVGGKTHHKLEQDRNRYGWADMKGLIHGKK